MRTGMDRREFLQRGIALGGAAALGSAAFPLEALASSRRRPSMLDLPAREAPVDHVVILMMENRSFDHFLGWLAHDERYVERGLSRFGGGFRVNGDQSQVFEDKEGRAHDTYYLPKRKGESNPYRGCEHPDPGHGWDEGRAQRDRGFLARGTGNDEFAIGFYRKRDVPLYEKLARRFTIFDRYHCSLLASTFPNREYLYGGQSGGHKDNYIPFQEQGFQWPTIVDHLDAAGVPVANYFVDLPTTALWGARMGRFQRHIERYFADAEAGTLPEVTFVDPGFTTGYRTDDHPYADIRAGQKFVANVVEALVHSPLWERSVFFITYDEWGGFFEHVKPIHLPDGRASKVDDEDFSQAGFRVPTFMGSPYARRGFVDHRVYDHTSILRFLEWRFLGAPPEGPKRNGSEWWLTRRDRHANNIGRALLPDRARTKTGLDDEFQEPVASEPCPGEEGEGLPFPAPLSPLELERRRQIEMHAFERAAELGFFDRVRAETAQKPVPLPFS